MSVEDIDFLYQNSITEDIIILVDSAKRDRLVWHEPNRFQIDFVEPFKMVCGVDILDINIPRTMYSIETHNNALNFKIGVGDDWMNFNDYTRKVCEVRDYTLQELINELNDNTGSLYANNIIVATETTSTNDSRKSVLIFANSDNPPNPFIFDMQNSTIGSILGFDEVATSHRGTIYTNFSKVYQSSKATAPTDTMNPYLFASVPENLRTYEVDVSMPGTPSKLDFTASQSLVHEIKFHGINIIDDFTVDDQIMFTNASEAIGNGTIEDKYSGFFIHGLEVGGEPPNGSSVFPPNSSRQLTFNTTDGTTMVIPVTPPTAVRLKVCFFKVDLPTTTTTGDAITEAYAAIHNFNPGSIVSTTTSSLPSNITKLPPEYFLEWDDTNHKFIYRIGETDYNDHIFSIVPITPFSRVVHISRIAFDKTDFHAQFLDGNQVVVDDYLQRYPGDFTSDQLDKYIDELYGDMTRCALKLNPDLTNTSVSVQNSTISPVETIVNVGSLSVKYHLSYIDRFNLEAPGLVKLMGERYVTVHCDNIENHLRGSKMFNDYSPGLALVNLGVVGYSQQRMDFYSVKYKRFHPIGKLNNLQFTVKRSGDQLYDLKGVNWHMLMSIKYYVPRMGTNFRKSSLNPNYNFDFMKYANKYINKYTKQVISQRKRYNHLGGGDIRDGATLGRHDTEGHDTEGHDTENDTDDSDTNGVSFIESIPMPYLQAEHKLRRIMESENKMDGRPIYGNFNEDETEGDTEEDTDDDTEDDT